MPRLTSFPPIASPDARVLILGSMPGEESLRRQEYYAHPQNAFWFIMGELFSAGADLPYPERTGRLREAGVAVWDVLKHCRRAGSLDVSINPRRSSPTILRRFSPSIRGFERFFSTGARPRRCSAARFCRDWERVPRTPPCMCFLQRVPPTRRCLEVRNSTDGVSSARCFRCNPRMVRPGPFASLLTLPPSPLRAATSGVDATLGCPLHFTLSRVSMVSNSFRSDGCSC